MHRTASTEDRVAIIQALAERWPAGQFGRTKLIKCIYFLQAVRRVPLGYNFRLYSYGPYDSAVLNDLDYAKALGHVDVTTVHHSGSFGYDIKTTKQTADENPFVQKHLNDVNWVIGEFGRLTPAQLELAATAVYADRESPQQRIDTLVEQVHRVKPHFSTEQVSDQVSFLRTKGLLSATT